MFFRLIIAAGLAAALAVPAIAETYHRTVNAGRATEIEAIGYYSRSTCQSAALPRYTLGVPPKHGTVTFKKTTWQIKEESSRCRGKPLKGLSVIYTPDRGYRGEDSFRLDHRYYIYSGSSQFTKQSTDFVVKVK